MRKRVVWLDHLVLGLGGIASQNMVGKYRKKVNASRIAKGNICRARGWIRATLYRLSLNGLKWQCPVHRRTQIRALSHVYTLGDKSHELQLFSWKGHEYYAELHPPKNIKEENRFRR